VHEVKNLFILELVHLSCCETYLVVQPKQSSKDSKGLSKTRTFCEMHTLKKVRV